MPAEFTKCVSDLKAQGKSEDSAYAICVSSYMKKHGKSPFAKEDDINILPISESQKSKFRIILEAEKGGKKVKILLEEVTGSIIKTT